MSKRIVTLVIALSAVAGLSAQSRVQLGVRAGITSQDMELRLSDVPGTDIMTESRLGFHVAAVARIRLLAIGTGVLGTGLFLQPEVLYSQNDYLIKESGSSASRIRMQSVTVPVLVSFKLSLARIYAGPLFNAMYKTDTVKGDVGLMSQKPSVGYSVGASVDLIGGLVLDGRFNGQFRDMKNNIGNLEESIRGSLSSWSLGLSWFF